MKKLSSKAHPYTAAISILLIVLAIATLMAGMAGCSGGVIPVRNWYDLDRVRNNLGGSYILMQDLDTNTTGYFAVASATANDGKGWNPIGSSDDPFTGTFDGQGYEIRDMVINRPTRTSAGLFGAVREGVVKNLGVVNATVTGQDYVGGLVGWIRDGAVSVCNFMGNVTGRDYVGGLVGWNELGPVDNCYAAGNITGESTPDHYSSAIGGLVGYSSEGSVSNSSSSGTVTADGKYHGGLVGRNEWGRVDNCYSNSNVAGGEMVGGLVGYQWGYYYSYVESCVVSSYSTGNVTGCCVVGGLVGYISGGSLVGNSHYNYDEVLINGQNMITIGALFGDDFEEWLANGKSLLFGNRFSFDDDGYIAINNISDFKQLLAFGQDSFNKFRLKSDLDLASEPDFYIPYLAGEFDGDGHTIFNLNVSLDSAFGVGLFGYLDLNGKVINVSTENVDITADWAAGGLVGNNEGTVSNSYSTGSIRGHEFEAGGLVGSNSYGNVVNSYSSCNVSGMFRVGGLVGRNEEGSVESSYSIGNVTGDDGVGGLVGSSSAGVVNNSFWDTETSGQSSSAGGTGKTTAEMQDIATFSGATWNITEVANLSTRNLAYIWNIVDDLSYPFLSWQP